MIETIVPREQNPALLARAKSIYGFASGGVIHPGDSQQVSFFKSPQETVGIFTPQQMDALASCGASTGCPRLERGD